MLCLKFCFCENVSYLFIGFTKLHCDSSFCDKLSNEMMMNIYVLGSAMKCWLPDHCDCFLILKKKVG